MIVSASRRTDVPAFYADWMMNRLRAGWVAVPNPMNRNQISVVSLRPQDVDVIVFWTRNARPLLPHLDELKAMGHAFYFQYTITGYPRWLEPHAPPLASAVDTLLRLSDVVGPKRVVWRYDPILFSDEIDEDYHFKAFLGVCSKLSGYSSRCVISFLDFYRKARSNLARLDQPISDAPRMDVVLFAKRMAEIGAAHGFELVTCAETLRLEEAGVWPGRCIDGDLIRDLFGIHVDLTKDPGQRDACGCVRSKDIGIYDSCLHGCAYCYATASLAVSLNRRRGEHNPASASLLGWTDPATPPCAQSSEQLGLFRD